MSLSSKFESEVQAEIHAKIESGFSGFRDHVVAGVKARLAAAKDLAELHALGKKYGYTQERMDSYARSHAGLTKGRFARYVKFHKFWAEKVPADLLCLCDEMAMWYILRMPDDLIPGAVRAYIRWLRKGREDVKGIYIRGQVITWDDWRYGKWHKNWEAKRTEDREKAEEDAVKDAVKVLTGRIVNLTDENPRVGIRLIVTGTVKAKPTKAAAKKLVLKAIKNGEIQFD